MNALIYNYIKSTRGYFMNNSIIIADSRIINLDEIVAKHFDASSPIISSLLPRPDTKFFPNVFEKLNFYLDKVSSNSKGKIKLLLESELWLNLETASEILCEAVIQIENYLNSKNITNVSVEPWIIYARALSVFNCHHKPSYIQNQA
jgi:hypothetical protein